MIRSGAMMVDKEDTMAELFKKVRLLSQRNALDHVNIQRSRRGIVMTLSDKLLFSSGQSELSHKAIPLMGKIAEIINTMKTPVEIEGHTDDVPIHTHAFASNWELSTARAVNVLRFLTTDGKVDPKHVSAVGMAEYHPVVPNDTAENRSINRRVEIIFKVN